MHRHSQTGDCQGLRARRVGKRCLMGIEFGMAGKFCRWMMETVAQQCEIYLMPMNWTLKDGYAGKFCSALFYYNKKKCEGHC